MNAKRLDWDTRLAAVAWLAIALAGAPGLVVTSASAQTKPASPAPSSASAAPSLSATELDRLLAPIALYPDALLAQMLQAAANPGAVSKFHAWLGQNTSLKGTDLQDAATKAGFEPSLVALALFPDVVKRMAEQLDRTTQLGQAFTKNRSAVFDSIQRLRAQAQKAGNLKTTAQQEVETQTTSSGQQVIVIEPANPQIVYVPTYNPQTVYTTVVVENNNSADAAVAGLIGFTAGIAIGAAFDNDYYYGPYGWHGGGYMYNDAWDDYYDHREDQREDWMDHREEIVEERGDRAENAQEQRTDRQENRSENRPEGQAQRTEAQANRQQNRPQSQAATQSTSSTRSTNATGATSSTRSTSSSTGSTSSSTRSTASGATSRGYSTPGQSQATRERSATSSDAFSGYSSGRSTSSSSARGSSSRSSSRASRGGGGGGGRRR
jgi:Protein of unknown function (DUF3300)